MVHNMSCSFCRKPSNKNLKKTYGMRVLFCTSHKNVNWPNEECSKLKVQAIKNIYNVKVSELLTKTKQTFKHKRHMLLNLFKIHDCMKWEIFDWSLFVRSKVIRKLFDEKIMFLKILPMKFLLLEITEFRYESLISTPTPQSLIYSAIWSVFNYRHWIGFK